MKPTWAICRILSAALFVLSLAVVERGVAQESGDINIRRLTMTKRKTPEYTAKVKGALQERTRDWAEIICLYDTSPDFVDELEFTYYVIMKTKDNREPFVLLKGTITYVHIEKGRHQSTMYIHPSVLARYGDIDGIAVEVRAGGRLVAVEADGPSGRRYQQAMQQLPVREGYVMNPMQTPFAMLGYDNNEMMKP